MSVRDTKRETLNSFFHLTLQNGTKTSTEVTFGTHPRLGKPDGVLTATTGPASAAARRALPSTGTHRVAITLPRTCAGNQKHHRMRPFHSFDHDTGQDYSDDAPSTDDAFIVGRRCIPRVGRSRPEGLDGPGRRIG